MNQVKLVETEELVYLSDEAFIHHCFVRILGCVCNPLRANQYLAALASGSSRKEVVQSIVKEDKYTHLTNTAALRKLPLLDGETFLREAYRRILGRSIDNNGVQCYSKSLLMGEKKLRILYDLATSSEGQARCALHPELNDFVKFLTRENALLVPIRLTDIVGLFTSKDDEFVHKAYRIFLKREADVAGLAAHEQALHNTLSKIKVLHSLAYSSEGRGFLKTLPVRLYLIFGRFF